MCFLLFGRRAFANLLRIRRGGSGSYLLDYKQGLGLLLDKPNQLIRVHIKGRGNAPDGFEICLLAAAFYHCKMASRKLCKPAENLLRKPFARVPIYRKNADLVSAIADKRGGELC